MVSRTCRSSWKVTPVSATAVITPSAAMMAAFADLVRDHGPVADLGCGPGRLTAHLTTLGLPAFGIDVSPKMIELARDAFPDLRFTVGSMTALDIGNDEHLRPTRGHGGHPVSYESYLLSADRIATLLGATGLAVTTRLLREPDEDTKRQHACFLARKP
jgi:SAM-dependent methyltransferase